MIDVPSEMVLPLFVYGTLRDAARMAEALNGASDWRYVARATVNGEVYDAGEYPALSLRAGGPPVEGLLVEFRDPAAALAALDVYEDVASNLFVRRLADARLEDGFKRPAWVYEYGHTTMGLRRLTHPWPLGRGESAGRVVP